MEQIVLFDGVCNFCNGAVNFIIRHDRDRLFKFAALQSEAGSSLKKTFSIGDDIDSVVLVAGGQAYTHSTAGLRIARGLGFPFSLAFALIIVPAPIRDYFYRLFARYRYRIFGRLDACMLPTPDVRERFIDNA